MSQAHIKRARPRFTKEQIEERKQFQNALQNGKANIVFTGTFDEGVSFLDDTGKLVDACNNS